ncbi:hypothetical protein AACH06_23855 [Ideonella sp. DXS29W]|uniref:DUF3558 domain-containing protein n=1 Tax=Ideonella lacteola TaxID=2984193 RepID=A0ABU9BVN3_9BURK
MLSITGVLLAGCQDRNPPAAVGPGGEIPAAASHATNACARLSDAQAAQVLSLPAVKSHPENAEACHWDSGQPDTPFPILNLSVNAYGDEASAAKLFAATSGMQSKLSRDVNAALGEKAGERVPGKGRAPAGLGDEAWLQLDDVAGADTALLVVRHAAVVYTLGVAGIGSTQGLADRLEAAGRAVVSRP